MSDITENTPFPTANSPDPKPPESLICFENVSLCFQKHASIFDLMFAGKKRNRAFWALQDVSFSVSEGETIGVIGRNGSGKSTLSLVCTKIYRPDRGQVDIKGRVQLLALGVGFEKQLSGRENIFISGSLMGMKMSEIRQHMDDIEAFADIGDFMDEPMRTYSSGMKSRLAFAIATAVHPEILILDEVLATGDRAFRDKAMKRMKNLKSLARCALIISHSPGQLKKLCNKVIWLDKGRIVMQGKPVPVLNAYKSFCENPEAWAIDADGVLSLKEKVSQHNEIIDKPVSIV